MNYTIPGKPLSVNNAKASVVIKGRARLITTKKARAWKHAAMMNLFAQKGKDRDNPRTEIEIRCAA